MRLEGLLDGLLEHLHGLDLAVLLELGKLDFLRENDPWKPVRGFSQKKEHGGSSAAIGGVGARRVRRAWRAGGAFPTG